MDIMYLNAQVFNPSGQVGAYLPVWKGDLYEERSDDMILSVDLLIIVILLWVPLIFLLLPVHWLRRRCHAGGKKETIRTVITRALTISIFLTFFIGSGLIAMFFDQYFGRIH